MALVKGNVSDDIRTPGASSYSFAHTQNVGPGGVLVLIIVTPTVNVSSVTYGGQAMTSKRNYYDTNYTVYHRVYELTNPPTGSNTVQVTLASPQYNPISAVAYSFTGSDGVGTLANTTTAATPQTLSLTISAGSMIIGSVLCGNATGANLEIPQNTARTLQYIHNVNNFTWGACSPGLSAGATLCESNASATMSLTLTEIKEIATTAARRIFIV